MIKLLHIVLWIFFFMSFSTLVAQPALVTVSPDGSYTLLNPQAPDIRTYSKDGELLNRFGGWSLDSEYGFEEVVHLFSQSGLKHYVSDKGQQAVLVFDRRLQLISFIDTSPISPVASSLISGERLLVIDKSLQYWTIIDTRSGTKTMVELDEKLDPAYNMPVMIANAEIFIPIKSDDVEQNKYQLYQSFSAEGQFLCNYSITKPILAYSVYNEEFWILSDQKLSKIRCNQQTDQLFKFSIRSEEPSFYFFSSEQIVVVEMYGKVTKKISISNN